MRALLTVVAAAFKGGRGVWALLLLVFLTAASAQGVPPVPPNTTPGVISSINIDTLIPNPAVWLRSIEQILSNAHIMVAFCKFGVAMLLAAFFFGFVNAVFFKKAYGEALKITIMTVVCSVLIHDLQVQGSASAVPAMVIDTWVRAYNTSTNAARPIFVGQMQRDTAAFATAFATFISNQTVAIRAISSVDAMTMTNNAAQNTAVISTQVAGATQNGDAAARTVATQGWIVAGSYLLMLGMMMVYAGAIILLAVMLLLTIFVLPFTLAVVPLGNFKGLEAVALGWVGSIASVAVLPFLYISMSHLAMGLPQQYLTTQVNAQNAQAAAYMNTYATQAATCNRAFDSFSVPVVGGLVNAATAGLVGPCTSITTLLPRMEAIGAAGVNIMLAALIVAVLFMVGNGIAVAAIRLVPGVFQGVIGGLTTSMHGIHGGRNVVGAAAFRMAGSALKGAARAMPGMAAGMGDAVKGEKRMETAAAGKGAAMVQSMLAGGGGASKGGGASGGGAGGGGTGGGGTGGGVAGGGGAPGGASTGPGPSVAGAAVAGAAVAGALGSGSSTQPSGTPAAAGPGAAGATAPPNLQMGGPAGASSQGTPPAAGVGAQNASGPATAGTGAAQGAAQGATVGAGSAAGAAAAQSAAASARLSPEVQRKAAASGAPDPTSAGPPAGSREAKTAAREGRAADRTAKQETRQEARAASKAGEVRANNPAEWVAAQTMGVMAAGQSLQENRSARAGARNAAVAASVKRGQDMSKGGLRDRAMAGLEKIKQGAPAQVRANQPGRTPQEREANQRSFDARQAASGERAEVVSNMQAAALARKEERGGAVNPQAQAKAARDNTVNSMRPERAPDSVISAARQATQAGTDRGKSEAETAPRRTQATQPTQAKPQERDVIAAVRSSVSRRANQASPAQQEQQEASRQRAAASKPGEAPSTREIEDIT